MRTTFSLAVALAVGSVLQHQDPVTRIGHTDVRWFYQHSGPRIPQWDFEGRPEPVLPAWQLPHLGEDLYVVHRPDVEADWGVPVSFLRP